MRDEALIVQSDLEKEVARRTKAQRDLDSLYNSIFQGLTPDFPEEDATERDLQVVAQQCNDARMKLESQQQAMNLLNQATVRLKSALSYIEEALDHSRMDMFGGGSITDLMERDALHKAGSQVQQMQMLVMQAQRYSSEIQDLAAPHIPQGSLVSDVFFDNIFSDMAFHEQIKESREKVRECGAALAARVQAASARVHDCEAEMARLSEQRNSARVALQKARERIFERSSNDGEALPPQTPPKYGASSHLPPPTPPKDSGSNEPPPPYAG